MHGSEVFEPIVSFLRGVGVPVTLGSFGPSGFLPGVQVVGGGLQVDPAHLVAAGDLLHESGHIAIVPPDLRPLLQDNLGQSFASAAANDPRPEVQLAVQRGESMAIAWSYAALRAAQLTPACVFFPDSYHMSGASLPGLLAQLEAGNTFGVDGLARLGLTGNAGVHRLLYDNELPAFPHMTRWLVP